MSVYDLYQSYLNAQKQVAPSLGILDPRLLYPQNYQGDGDGLRGGGDFGNLDMSRGKEVTRDVYQDVLGPPGAFEFSPQTMMAYPNLSSGLYQTYEGKNVDGLLSNTGATFGLAGLAMKMMGMQPKTVGGFVPGSIRGKFDTIGDVFNYITGKDRREAKAAQEAAQQDVLEKTNAARINAQQYTGGGGGGGGFDTSAADKAGTSLGSGQFSPSTSRGRSGY
jgi:hypothetical protein